MIQLRNIYQSNMRCGFALITSVLRTSPSSSSSRTFHRIELTEHSLASDMVLEYRWFELMDVVVVNNIDPEFSRTYRHIFFAYLPDMFTKQYRIFDACCRPLRGDRMSPPLKARDDMSLINLEIRTMRRLNTHVMRILD